MRLPTIPPGLAGKIVKYRPLSEPIISGFGGVRPLASLKKNKKSVLYFESPWYSVQAQGTFKLSVLKLN